MASPPNPPPLLELTGVSKTFTEGGQTRTICQDLHLSLAKADKIAIFGRSGIGKSTLINLMCGIDLPDTGEVRFNQQTLNTLPDHKRTLLRRRMMGIVFQFFNLIPTLTALENVLLPLSLNRLLTPEKRAAAQQLLTRLKLGNRGDDYPEHLSGGEQQRVAIARALIHEPAVLFADEPTGNLDAETAEDVLQHLHELADIHQTSLVIVSHSEQVTPYVEQIYHMQDGRLFAS